MAEKKIDWAGAMTAATVWDGDRDFFITAWHYDKTLTEDQRAAKLRAFDRDCYRRLIELFGVAVYPFEKDIPDDEPDEPVIVSLAEKPCYAIKF